MRTDGSRPSLPIHDGSKPAQWLHVRSALNPADELSRGLFAKEVLTSQR